MLLALSFLQRIWLAVVSILTKQNSLASSIDELRRGQKAQDVVLSQIVSSLASLDAQLKQVIDILTPGPAVRLVFTAFKDDGSVQTGVEKMDLRDDQQVVLSIQPLDAKGKPALVDGIPTWAGSDDTTITVTPAADGMSATVVGVTPGVATVSVVADADLGQGVSGIKGTLDFNVTAGAAATIAITAGTPTNQ